MGLLIIFMQKAIGQGIGILYGALGEILTEKSGNLNLGIPGMMYMGGIAGSALSFMKTAALRQMGLWEFLFPSCARFYVLL